jgi:hypothetical protein
MSQGARWGSAVIMDWRVVRWIVVCRIEVL